MSAAEYEPSATFQRLSPAVIAVVRSARDHGLEDREIVERVLDGTIVTRLCELLELGDEQRELPIRIAVVKSGPAFEHDLQACECSDVVPCNVCGGGR